MPVGGRELIGEERADTERWIGRRLRTRLGRFLFHGNYRRDSLRRRNWHDEDAVEPMGQSQVEVEASSRPARPL